MLILLFCNSSTQLIWIAASPRCTCDSKYRYIVFTVTQQRKWETVQWKKPRKWKCYKRLTYKQFSQVSGLCVPQFLSYLPKRFTHPCRALYGDAILMYRFGAPIWRPEINKNIWGSLFRLKLFPFTRKLAYVGINIPSNTWNGYTAENQEERLFFNETAIPFSCHALWKRGSSNYCIFEIKHATEMETSTKIYFSFTFNLV